MKFLKQYSSWLAAFVFAVAVIAVYKTFDNFGNILESIGKVFSVLLPFFMGFVIAYILNLPVKKLNGLVKKIKNKFVQKHSYGISIFVVYLLTIGLLAFIISAIVPAVYKGLIEISTTLPQQIITAINGSQTFGFFDEQSSFNLAEHMADLIKSFDFTEIGKYAEGVFKITSNVINIFFAAIVSVYMLLDKERILDYIIKTARIFIKEENVDRALAIIGKFNEVFTNYIYSRLICCIVMAVASVLVLSICRVKYALVLGITIGLFDMLPYFGSIISSVFCAIITFVTGGMWQGILISVILLVMQQLDGNVLAPKVTGSKLDIHPLVIIFAVVVGGGLFGIAGMFFSVPVIAVVKAMLDDYFALKGKNKNQ